MIGPRRAGRQVTHEERYRHGVRRGWLLGLLGLIVTALAACQGGGIDPGTPPATTTATPEATGIALPPRPRDIRIDGVDPCSLLTEEQRARLGLDGPVTRTSISTRLYGRDSAVCGVSGSRPRDIFVGIVLVTTVGIERYTTGELLVQIQPADIQGFPALVVIGEHFEDNSCSVVVDVASGQLVDVHYSDAGPEPYPSRHQLCESAKTAAREVVASLMER